MIVRFARRAAPAVLAGCLLAVAEAAIAAGQRAFVASTGVDSNPCTLAQPCRSFAAAIAQTFAGGEVLVLDTAGYGPVTITNSVSIIAAPGVYAGVAVSVGNGITIDGPSAAVVLHGLSINGLGGDNGILVLAASSVVIENCVVSRMAHVGIKHVANGADLTLRDTIVRDNGEDGIWAVAGSATILVERVASDHNASYGMYIASGVATAQVDATITDSSFVRNSLNGVRVDSLSINNTFVSIDRSTLARNGHSGLLVKGISPGPVGVTVQRSTFRRNDGDGIELDGTSGALVELNALGNVFHRNFHEGVNVNGALARAYVSGNNFDPIVCRNGGAVASFGDNSVDSVNGACTTLKPPH